MNDIIYKVFRGSEEIFDECDSIEEAKRLSDDWWSDHCLDYSDNVTRTDTFQIVTYNTETDERLATESYEVRDDCYHGDYAEHNTHWGL